MLGRMRAVTTLADATGAIALCGGPYSNFAAVEAFLAATTAMPRFCLGDIGGFGPDPDRTLDLIRAHGVACIQGNYDHAVGYDERDCGCGYVDPLDRKYAQVSFDYTAAHTSERHKAWLRGLPPQRLLRWRGARILLVHGSPDAVNEFVWDSETGDAAIDGWLVRENVDGICATHSGLPWIRRTSRGFWCNVGVLGRPAHDGTPRVGYAMLRHDNARVEPALRSLDYDVAGVASAMRAAGLPDAFAASLETGLWTTCYNILPAAERVPGERYVNARHSGERDARDVAAAQGD
jgi:hypothetical protein